MGDEKSNEPKHKHTRPQWAGRDIVDQDHASELDRTAALHEFEGKMPRKDAEDRAYHGYQRQQHAKAAAHHYTGIKLAEAAGDSREGRKHGLMYQLHLKQLGHEPIGPVPDEVQQHLRGGGDDEASRSSRAYNFKAHRGDIFVLPDALGKAEKEKAMANETATKQLQWVEHEDASGGYFEALDKSERVSYRTWEIPQGNKPSKHVLVKNDGMRQTTVNYFAKREDAQAEAEGCTVLARSERDVKSAGAALAKAEALVKASGSGLAAVHAAMKGSAGGRIAEKGEMSADGSGGAIREGSSSPSRSAHEESSSSAGSASSDGRPPWLKKDGTNLMAMSESCGKCGSKAAECRCGNMGKSELCKKCSKASNLCKCVGLGKSEAQVKLAADEDAANKVRLAEGAALLAKVASESNPPSVGFGTDDKGGAQGLSPEVLRERLHNIYVAASYAVEQAKK